MGMWKFVFACPKIKDEFKNVERKICVAAHSTPYFDGIILYYALKYFGEKNLLIYARGPCPYFPEWCRSIGNSGGFIREECDELLNAKDFCRVIFPSGGTVTWKTGFYVLAKKLNAKIVRVLFNYGCETYTYNIIQLYYCRGVCLFCLLFILFFYYSVGLNILHL